MTAMRNRVISAFVLFAACWVNADVVQLEVSVPPDTTGDVFVSGSLPYLGPWNPSALKLARGDDGLYRGQLEAPAGTNVEYKFTRGSWATVEKTPNGAEKPNRMLTVGKTNSPVKIEVARWAENGESPATRPSTIDGRVDVFEIESTALKNKRKIWVWLPPEYDEKKTYPVLYMADGRNLFDEATSSFGREWAMDEAAGELISSGKIRPVIIVGIDHSDRRSAEFMSKDMNYGKAYGTFVVKEVKPVIEAHYKTAPGPANTFCGGASLGGLVSLAMVMDFPETFGGALVVSPSLWAEDQMVEKRAEAGGVNRSAKIYVDIGGAEGEKHITNARALAKSLEQQNIPSKYVEAPNAEHNETAWAARAKGMLEFLFAK